jgi:prefoldin alpha subunit
MAQENQQTIAEAQAQLRYLQGLYSQQYQLLDNEIASFSLAMATLSRNIEMLENKDRLANSTILINGEGGAYIEASIKSLNKVLVYIGAGYLVEKGTEDAKDYLKGNSKKQEDTLKKLVSDKQKIEKELVDISYKLSALEGSAGVR